MEQIPLNGFVQSLFAGIKAAKEENYYPRKFEEMSYTTRLFEVDELEDMYSHARSKTDHEAILDHMYRFDATQVGYFKRIEKKIINHYWEG